MTFANKLKDFTVIFAPLAKKELAKINKSDALKIKEKLNKLVSGIQNLGIIKMASKKIPTYRFRVGNYRVIYEIHKQKIIIKVIQIGDRKEVYNF